MKFKYLIIVFSIIIVLFILITALVSSLMAEPQYAVNFKNIALALLLFMLLLLICMGIYFFLNYRLFSLLEREDWPAIAYYLEQKIYGKRRYSSKNVQLLASSYLVISDYSSVLKLESKAMLVKPPVVHKNALIFGVARILSGNYADAVTFFKTLMDRDRGKEKDKQWIRWFYGFSQLLAGAFSMAEPEFASLAVSSGDAFISGLSAYFLHSVLLKHSKNPEECRSAAENGRSRLVETFKNEENWRKGTAKAGTEIHVTIIKKYIDEAGKWLFNG